MSDMIGLLRFGMPVTPIPVAPQVEALMHRAAPAVAAVASASGGGQTAGHYSATPRPTISPQFAYASAVDGATDATAPGDSGASAVIALPKPFDPDVLTGPPPAFEATLMQVEAHLRLSLARIHAGRNAHPLDRQQVEKPKVEGRGDAAPAEPAKPAGKVDAAPQPVPRPVQTATANGTAAKPAEPAPTGGKADAPRPKASAEPAPAE